MKVSVVVTSFNHERFIAQALRSVLSQRVDFDLEIIVSDDASSDGSRAIIEAAAARDPRLRLLPAAPNRGALANFEHAWGMTSGEYVASLDGDDHWTAPDRLQRMADFLDAHPDYSMCFHDMSVDFDGRGDGPGVMTRFCPPNLPPRLTLDDVVVDSFALPSSSMVRRGLADRLPPELAHLKIYDWPRFVLTAARGDIGYISEPLGVYRIHSGGHWSRGGAWLDSMDESVRMQRGTLACYEAFWPMFGGRFQRRLRPRLAKLHLNLTVAHSEREDWPAARHHVRSSLRYAVTAPASIDWWRWSKSAVLSHAPVLKRLKRRLRSQLAASTWLLAGAGLI